MTELISKSKIALFVVDAAWDVARKLLIALSDQKINEQVHNMDAAFFRIKTRLEDELS